MKTKFSMTIAIAALAIVILMNGCEKKGCPEGMHEYTLPDGQRICVPDDLGK